MTGLPPAVFAAFEVILVVTAPPSLGYSTSVSLSENRLFPLSAAAAALSFTRLSLPLTGHLNFATDFLLPSPLSIDKYFLLLSSVVYCSRLPK